MAPVGFAVSDAESSPASLAVAATSNNQTLVPDSAIVLGGSGESRTVIATPAAPNSSTQRLASRAACSGAPRGSQAQNLKRCGSAPANSAA